MKAINLISKSRRSHAQEKIKPTCTFDRRVKSFLIIGRHQEYHSGMIMQAGELRKHSRSEELTRNIQLNFPLSCLDESVHLIEKDYDCRQIHQIIENLIGLQINVRESTFHKFRRR